MLLIVRILGETSQVLEPQAIEVPFEIAFRSSLSTHPFKRRKSFGAICPGRTHPYIISIAGPRDASDLMSILPPGRSMGR